MYNSACKPAAAQLKHGMGLQVLIIFAIVLISLTEGCQACCLLDVGRQASEHVQNRLTGRTLSGSFLATVSKWTIGSRFALQACCSA
jgi:hypothetical protein